MQRPFLFGVHHPVRFENALRQADTRLLRILFDQMSSTRSEDFDPHRSGLIQAELRRRHNANLVAGLATAFTMAGCVVLVLL